MPPRLPPSIDVAAAERAAPRYNDEDLLDRISPRAVPQHANAFIEAPNKSLQHIDVKEGQSSQPMRMSFVMFLIFMPVLVALTFVLVALFLHGGSPLLHHALTPQNAAFKSPAGLAAAAVHSHPLPTSASASALPSTPTLASPWAAPSFARQRPELAPLAARAPHKELAPLASTSAAKAVLQKARVPHRSVGAAISPKAPKPDAQ